MTEKYFALPAQKALLQIGNGYAPIPIEGDHSYGVCGKNVILYLVQEDCSVVGLVLKGGYINRIKTYHTDFDSWLHVCVDVWTLDENPKLISEDFSYEIVAVL